MAKNLAYEMRQKQIHDTASKRGAAKKWKGNHWSALMGGSAVYVIKGDGWIRSIGIKATKNGIEVREGTTGPLLSIDTSGNYYAVMNRIETYGDGYTEWSKGKSHSETFRKWREGFLDDADQLRRAYADEK